MRLAEVAAHVLGEERVEELFDAWAEEKISTRELKRVFKEAINVRGARGR